MDQAYATAVILVAFRTCAELYPFRAKHHKAANGQ